MSAPLEILIRLRDEADVLRVEGSSRLTRPIATELLRAQHAFNTRVAEVCLEWLSLVHAPEPANAIATLFSEEEADVRTHRTGLAGTAVVATKKVALQALNLTTAKWLEAQERFNRAALSFLQKLTGGEDDTAELHSTESVCAFESKELQSRIPALAPWLQKQRGFNALLLEVLSAHERTLIGSHAKAWALWQQADEPSTNPVLAGQGLRWAFAFRHAPTARCIASLPWNDDSWLVVNPAAYELPEELKARATEPPLTDVDAVLVLDGTEVLRPERFSLWNTGAEADLWYADSDSLEADGTRSRPRFKPAFSELLYSDYNYLGSCLAMKASVFETLGAGGISASQAVWRTHAQQLKITRVSSLLWSQTVQSKPALHHIACTEYWKSSGARFSAQMIPSAVFPVAESTRATLVIPTLDRVDRLQSLLESLKAFPPGVPFDVVLLSNSSTDPDMFAFLNSVRGPEVRLFDHNGPFHWSVLNNLGAKQSTADVLVFLNSDVEFKKVGWLKTLCGYALRPTLGPVGAVMHSAQGTVQHAGLTVGLKGLAGPLFRGYRSAQGDTAFGTPAHSREVTAVSDVCMAIERAKFEKLSGFDTGIAGAGGDVDLCLRAKQHGWRSACLAGLDIVVHALSGRGIEVPPTELERAYGTYRAILEAGDPWFHPALSTASCTVLPWLDGETPIQRITRALSAK